MKKTVLIIEDEPIIGELMSIILEIQGFKVISLSDTTYASKKLQDKEVDLVMLDLNLGGQDGSEFCEYIKSQDDLNHIPVILVSANINLTKIAEKCGADDFIAKPFEINSLMEKVKAHT
jgi:DNA-binding response OmpR family regulator